MPKRIVVFTTNIAVDNRRLMNQVHALNDAGFEVQVIALGRKGENPPHLKLASRLTIDYIFLTTRSLPKSPVFHLLKYLELNLRVIWKAWILRADCYHARALSALPAMWVVTHLHRRSFLVFDAPELFFERPFVMLPKLWRWMYSILINSVDLIFAANDFRAKIMYEEYGTPALPTVIHNYPSYREVVESNKLQRFVEYSNRNWNFILLHQGGVRKDRAPEQLIKSLKYIDENAGLIFLGTVAEVYKNKLEELAVSEGVEDRLLFHDPVSLEELPAYTSSATIGLAFYLNTSRNNYYCAPTKVYEYLMAGIPVVGSSFPGLQEELEKNGVGLTASPEEPNMIASVINTLLLDSELRAVMARKGIQLVRVAWNWESEKVLFSECYRGLFNS